MPPLERKHMHDFKTILFFLAIILETSCNSTQVSKTNSSEDGQEYLNVSVSELLSNKSFYHRKHIQTKAYYLCSFEKSAILPELSLPPGYDSTHKMYNWSAAIWVSENITN